MHSAAISFFTQTWRAHAHPWRWAASLMVTVSAVGVSLAPPAVAPISPDAGAGAPVSASAASLGAATPGAGPREGAPNAGPSLSPADEGRIAASPPVAAAKPVLPVGKGMWLHRFEDAHGGDPAAIVGWAKHIGLTHIYLRLGSSKKDFYARGDLDRLLPVAHAAGLKVIGWDFPYLDDTDGDAHRANAEIRYTTPTGHRIDGFAADIETPAEGTNLTGRRAFQYADRLRSLVGPDYPLIAAVPRYNPKRAFPYDALSSRFDAFAPMVYWINRDPASDVLGTVHALRPLGKPVLPVGQAYDPAIDGNPQWAAPNRAQIDAFMKTAAELGVASVSFWAWSTASAEQWSTIRDDRSFEITAADAPTRTKAVQRVLTGLGHPTPISGAFDASTSSSLSALQSRIGLRPTGRLDESTVAALIQPRPSP